MRGGRTPEPPGRARHPRRPGKDRLYLSFTSHPPLKVNRVTQTTLVIQVALQVTKEIQMSFIRHLSRIGLVLIVGASLSGCVVRPLWWGDHGGHRHGEQRDHGSDRDRDRGHDHGRDDYRRDRR